MRAVEEQEAEDDKRAGHLMLSNWGAYLRAEQWPGPRDCQASPMFRDMKSAYRESTFDEAHDVDDGERCQDIVYSILSDSLAIAVHCFYADHHSHLNLSEATTNYEKRTGNKVSNRGFKKILDETCIRVGMASRMIVSGLITVDLLKMTSQHRTSQRNG